MTGYSVAGCFLSLVLCASVASAQPPQQSPVTTVEEPGRGEPLVPLNGAIFVLDKHGTEHRGRFLRFDDRELIMLIDDQERTFGRDVVTRIERAGDPLNNGAAIGAVIGLTLGLLQALTVAGMEAIVIQTGLYTLFGTCLDAVHQGRTLVYQSDPAAPVRRPGGVAAAFSVRW